jgi:transposase
MPKHVQTRAAQDEHEERQVRKLARSHHAPADWKCHAQMVVESWAGKTPMQIAAELDCHPKTVRTHLARFNTEGISGLGMREGAGRKPRLTERERSRILALVKQPPPGRLERRADETLEAREEDGSAQWSLDALTEAAHAAGIQVERSQIRRIYVREGVRWRHTHSWGTSDDEEFVPKGRRSSPTTHSRLKGRRPSAPMSEDQWSHAPSLQPLVGRRMVIGSRPHWSTVAATRRSGSTERCGYATARRSRAVRLRATPRITSSCSRTSKRTIQQGTSSSSRTI